MLPLWIIDLRNKESDRRKIFVDLLGQIDHVFIPKSPKPEDKTEEAQETEQKDETKSETQPSIYSTPSSQKVKKVNENVFDDTEEAEDDEISMMERIDATERKKAKRESYIEGDWWRYTPMDLQDYHISIDDGQENPDPVKFAEQLYKFQSDLVAEGQKFIRTLRESNARPDIKLNVVVLGDIEEEFTRILFPSLAGMIQKEKGRILPHHIHQGMEIIGMLYIPSNINTLHVKMRESMQRTLREIDVQHNVPDMRGYDHMMLYQDVQNRTDCYYRALNDEQLEQYLLQCLINLYLASDESHPLLSGTASAEAFYFSMGATSVCYDVENEDLKARYKFGLNLMRSLKNEGEDETANLKLSILKDDDYEPALFFDYNAINHLDNQEIDLEMDEPKPHPIKNLTHKYLKRYYYNRYLRNFTSDMMQKIKSSIENTTRGALEIIASTSKNNLKEAMIYIHERLKSILSDLSANDGGFPTIIRLFRKMQEQFSEKKARVQDVIRTQFWRKIEETGVPKRMQDQFMEYHDAYEDDIRQKNGGTRQNEMKKEAVKDLNDLLSQEATMLSRICRSIILGVMLALAVVPVLHLVSPHILNLGKVRRYAEWWSVGLFLAPILFQLLSWWRYERKKKVAINNLKALFLHDAYARVANRIETEIKNFYDRMIALGEKYVKRTENIRDEIEKGYGNIEMTKPIIPETMFNQPLLGGRFGREDLLPIPDAENTIISINFYNYKTSEIGNKEYYLFMNQHHNLLMALYKNVDLTDNLKRIILDNGKELLLSKEQQEEQAEKEFKEELKIFQTKLSLTIKDSIVPRVHATVGEVLVNNIDNKMVEEDIMESAVQYASTNGEITSSSDLELTDLKINEPRAVKYVFNFISTAFRNDQVDKYNILYKKYIFITRWRCFDYFPLNRILPMEDFDEKVRVQLVYEEEKNAKNKIKKSGKNNKSASTDTQEIHEKPEENKKYISYPSSLLLWALSPDDSSAEWFRLLDSDFFHEAYEEKEKYKEILNQND